MAASTFTKSTTVSPTETTPADPDAVTGSRGLMALMGYVNSGGSSTANRKMATGGIGRKALTNRVLVKAPTSLVNPD